MLAESERAPNERERLLLEQWVEQLAPRPEGEGVKQRATGWTATLRSLLPGSRRRKQLGRRLDRKRYDRAKAWLQSPRVHVTHVEATRVARVGLGVQAIHVFDIGDDRLFALDDDWFPTSGAAWPNSVFEIWYPARAHHLLGGVTLFCYGTELPIEREYDQEEVEQHSRRSNTGYQVCEVKEGVFPGKFENVLDAYARHVTGPATPGWGRNRSCSA